MEGLGSYFGGNYLDFIQKKEEDEEEFVGVIGSEIKIPSTIPVNSHAEQPIIGSVEPLEITSPISTEPAKDFTDVKSKIDYYEEKITWLEGIAEEKGGLGESGYDAYRYNIADPTAPSINPLSSIFNNFEPICSSLLSTRKFRLYWKDSPFIAEASGLNINCMAPFGDKMRGTFILLIFFLFKFLFASNRAVLATFNALRAFMERSDCHS